MKKCEWKEGKFEMCNNYHDIFGAYIKYTQGREHIFCPFCGADIRKPEVKYRAFEEGEMPVEFLDYYYQHNEEPSIYKATIVGMGLMRIDGDNWSAKKLFWQWRYKKSLTDPEWSRVGVKQIIGEKI